MKLDPVAYWQMHALTLRYQAEIDRLLLAKRQAMIDAGLDPKLNYDLNDADCSAIEQTPVEPPT